MATFPASQLQGAGVLVGGELNSTSDIKITVDEGSNQIAYITFDVDGGGSTTVPNLRNANFTTVDANGTNLHTAFSSTNFAYCIGSGPVDTGTFLIADDLPTISANTLRVRAVGLVGSVEIIVTTNLTTLPFTMPATIGTAP